MNPIISMMNQRNPIMNMMMPIYNLMQTVRDPMAAISQMASNDTRMQQVIDTVRQNGGIPQAVYAEAQKRNMNPNDVLNQARQMMQSFNMK